VFYRLLEHVGKLKKLLQAAIAANIKSRSAEDEFMIKARAVAGIL